MLRMDYQIWPVRKAKAEAKAEDITAFGSFHWTFFRRLPKCNNGLILNL
jgi:hypothetical protein